MAEVLARAGIELVGAVGTLVIGVVGNGGTFGVDVITLIGHLFGAG
jgi:hypothetical protein